MIAGHRFWVSRLALALGATLATVGCGSSGSNGGDASSAGKGGAGAPNGGDGSMSGTGTSGGASGGKATGGTGGGPAVQRPFWCDEYKVDAAQAEGWVSINPNVVGRGFGKMTSPIQTCSVSGSDWSVQASGTEADGIDTTTMNFELTGVYNGPGRYQGKLADGISVSFSHDD